MHPLDRPGDYPSVADGMLLAGHFDESDSYSTKRPGGMSEWLVTYTLGGQGYFRVPGREEAVSGAGEIALLAAGVPHQYGTVKGDRWHFVWMHFSPGMIEPSLLPDGPLSVVPVESEYTRKRVYRAFRRILTDSRERGPYWDVLCANALREVLLLIAQRGRRKMDSRVEETLHLLSRHMREPVQIETLARSVGVSPSRLSHLFKENTGHSIVDTLNRMRIRQAALLLEHTDRNATEACEDVGFQSYNHFINQFHKWMGMSPSAYKRKAKESGKG